MKKEIVWCLQGALELGTLWESEDGKVHGEFLGKPRRFDDWTEARGRNGARVLALAGKQKPRPRRLKK